MIERIIWDFNGTLLDDRDLCLSILNQLLAKRGLPAVTMERYLEIFTFPIREYYQRAGLRFDREPFEDMAVEFITQYHQSAPSLPLCAGALAVLDALEARRVPQIVLSATKMDLLARQLEELRIACFFDAVLGLGDIYAHSKEAVARDWLATQTIRPQNMLLIGDTAHDAQVAASLGCPCALVASGHYSRARLEDTGLPVLETLHELLPWMKEEGLLCIS